MSGGGTFLSRDSRSVQRPGAYINFRSIPRPNIVVGERGVSTGLVELPWYRSNEVVTVNAIDFLEGRALRDIGLTAFDTGRSVKHVSLLLSGCLDVRLMSANTGGSRASATIPLIGGKLVVEAQKFGTFGNDLLISIQRQPALPGDVPEYLVTTHIIGHETSDLPVRQAGKPRTNQRVSYPSELQNNDFVTFTVVSDAASVPVFPTLPPVEQVLVTTPTKPIAILPPGTSIPPVDEIENGENGENNEYISVEHPIATVPPGKIPPMDEQLINTPITTVPPSDIPPLDIGLINPPIATIPPSEIPPLDSGLINPPIGEVDENEIPPAGITGEFATNLTFVESINHGNQFVKRFLAKFEHQAQPGNRLIFRTYSEKMHVTSGVTQVVENMISNTVSVLGFWAPATNEMIVDQHANNYTVTIAEINEDNVIVAYSQNIFPAVDVDYETEVDLPAEQEGENEQPDWVDFPNNERFAVTATWTRYTPHVPASGISNPTTTVARHYFRIETDHVPAEGNRLVIHWQNRTNADVSPAEGITIGASRSGTGNFTSGNEISRTYAQLNATHGAYARVLELNPQNLVVRFGWVLVMRGSVPAQVQPIFSQKATITTKLVKSAKFAVGADIIRPLNELQNNFETEPQQIQFVEVAGIALTGGSNGTTNLQTRIPNYLRKIRNYTWQYTCPSGRRVGWQWTNERQKQLVRDFIRRLRDENGKYVQVAMARLPAGRLPNTLITKVA